MFKIIGERKGACCAGAGALLTPTAEMQQVQACSVGLVEGHCGKCRKSVNAEGEEETG